MGKNDKVNMPSSTAGITRYFDEFKSKITLTPGHVVVMCIVVMAIVIALHMFAGGWLGVS